MIYLSKLTYYWGDFIIVTPSGAIFSNPFTHSGRNRVLYKINGVETTHLTDGLVV